MPQYAHHGTLVASTVASTTLNEEGGIEVINRSGSAEIYFTISRTASAQPAPTVGGDDCYVVPASISSYVVPFPQEGQGPATVQLISSGTPSFSVIGVGGE